MSAGSPEGRALARLRAECPGVPDDLLRGTFAFAAWRLEYAKRDLVAVILARLPAWARWLLRGVLRSMRAANDRLSW